MANGGILVVDLGFSSAKYIFGEKKGRVPSAFRSKIGGYMYGEDAMVKSGSSYLKTPAELIRHYPEFVKICKERAGAGDQNVSLAVGLPYLFWEQESRTGGAVGQLKAQLSEVDGIDIAHVWAGDFNFTIWLQPPCAGSQRGQPKKYWSSKPLASFFSRSTIGSL